MDTKDLTSKLLNEILDFIGIKPEIDIGADADETILVNITGDDLNFLIGFKGESLDALQNILNMMLLRKTQNWQSVVVDINGYKLRKGEKIEALTKKFIDKVRFFEDEFALPPMTPYERRKVHMIISEYDDIASESTGEGEHRRVVLKPSKKS